MCRVTSTMHIFGMEVLERITMMLNNNNFMSYGSLL